MFDAIINKKCDLFIIHFSEMVDRQQSRKALELARSLMPKVKPGFTVIADLGRLTHMDFECAEDIGEIMDVCNKAEVAHVCPVISNPELEIGWNIISRFHYDTESVRIATFPSFYQAMKSIILEET